MCDSGKLSSFKNNILIDLPTTGVLGRGKNIFFVSLA
jgi:hypothetical protein